MNILEQGFRVDYEDRSLAFTEAPIDMKGLMRQRFRWSFGTLQAVWKHRAAFIRNQAMGLFALPNILIFQMFLPLVSPFIDIMFLYGVGNYFIDRHYHPESVSSASLDKLLVFFLGFLIIDFVTSSIAFSLERRHPANKGDGWLLFHIWLQRFAYRQVFSIVLFKTVKRAIDGKPFNWDKIKRTAKMKQADRSPDRNNLSSVRVPQESVCHLRHSFTVPKVGQQISTVFYCRLQFLVRTAQATVRTTASSDVRGGYTCRQPQRKAQAIAKPPANIHPPRKKTSRQK